MCKYDRGSDLQAMRKVRTGMGLRYQIPNPSVTLNLAIGKILFHQSRNACPLIDIETLEGLLRTWNRLPLVTIGKVPLCFKEQRRRMIAQRLEKQGKLSRNNTERRDDQLGNRLANQQRKKVLYSIHPSPITVICTLLYTI